MGGSYRVLLLVMTLATPGAAEVPSRNGTLCDRRDMMCSCDLTSLDCTGRGMTVLARRFPEHNVWGNAYGIPSFLLVSIDMSGNKLTSVPQDLFANLTLDAISRVDFSNNLITELPMGLFPATLTLQEFYVSHNLLRAIPPDFFHTAISLVTLDFSYNRLTSLPDKLTDFPQKILHRIYLNDNQLTVVPEGLRQFSAVITLSLGNNDITVIPPGVFDLMQHLGSLNMSDNMLTQSLENIFTNNTALAFLYLSNNQICALHPQCLQTNSALKTVDLSYNCLQELPNMLFSQHHSVLTDVILSSNQLTSFNVLWALPALQTLDLSGNEITTIVPASLDAGLNLTVLNLAANQIASLSPLECFPIMPQLRQLDLSQNKWQTIGNATLASFPGLQVLYLHYNAASFDAFAQPFVHQDKLAKLSLSLFRAVLSPLLLQPLRNSLQQLSVACLYPQGTAFDTTALQALKQLKGLAVRSCNVSQLPRLNGSTLQSLDLGLNAITTLRHDDLAAFPQLQALLLDSNDIRLIEEGVFSPHVGLPKISSLSMVGNPSACNLELQRVECYCATGYRSVSPTGQSVAACLPLNCGSVIPADASRGRTECHGDTTYGGTPCLVRCAAGFEGPSVLFHCSSGGLWEGTLECSHAINLMTPAMYAGVGVGSVTLLPLLLCLLLLHRRYRRRLAEQHLLRVLQESCAILADEDVSLLNRLQEAWALLDNTLEVPMAEFAQTNAVARSLCQAVNNLQQYVLAGLMEATQDKRARSDLAVLALLKLETFLAYDKDASHDNSCSLPSFSAMAGELQTTFAMYWFVQPFTMQALPPLSKPSFDIHIFLVRPPRSNGSDNICFRRVVTTQERFSKLRQLAMATGASANASLKTLLRHHPQEAEILVQYGFAEQFQLETPRQCRQFFLRVQRGDIQITQMRTQPLPTPKSTLRKLEQLVQDNHSDTAMGHLSDLILRPVETKLLFHLVGATGETPSVCPKVAFIFPQHEYMPPLAALETADGSFLIEHVDMLLDYSLCRHLARHRAASTLKVERALVVGHAYNLEGSSDLTFSEQEGREVENMWRSLVPSVTMKSLIGIAATRTALLAELSSQRTSFFHFAGHCDVVNARMHCLVCSPLSVAGSKYAAPSSSVPNFLCAEEIQRYDLRSCSLVVLSGCCSAFSDKEQLVGLGQAFLAAGVACVVVSLHDLNDQLSQQIMRAFYADLGAGNMDVEHTFDVARALSKAVRQVALERVTSQFWGGILAMGCPNINVQLRTGSYRLAQQVELLSISCGGDSEAADTDTDTETSSLLRH